MKKALLLMLAAGLIVAVPADARKKKKKTDKTTAVAKPKDVTRQGLFNVTKSGDNWFFEVPDSLVGRKFLTTTRFTATPANCGKFAGEQVNQQTVYWEKAPSGKTLLLRADLLVEGDTVRIFSVHLQTSGIAQLRRRFQKDYNREAPVDSMLGAVDRNSRIRAAQVREIRAETDASPYPVILAGDFNDTPSSYTYREMKGALTDGFRRCGNGYGGTFRYLGGLLRIDYIFYDDTFECVRYYMPSETVSDHKVVIAELRFK